MCLNKIPDWNCSHPEYFQKAPILFENQGANWEVAREKEAAFDVG